MAIHSSYSAATLRGDLFGGLTAGIVALPLALAFGVASGAGAAAGLYGAIALGLVAALFGGTRVQISGPTGPMTVVFASAIAALGGSFQMALAVVLVGGVLQIALGLLKVGGLVRYIPYPVISGFMSGIGVIIILLQLAPLMGAAPSPSPLQALAKLPDTLAELNLQALALGLMTFAIVWFTPMRISRYLPSPLLALCLCTLAAVLLKWQVPVIGDIPTGLPEFHLPQFSLAQWSLIFTLGLTLALLGTIDSLLTSLVADSITRTRHKPNKELIGQGLGNILCSFIGGLPGAGATMRTVVNVNAGGRTRLSGMVHALFLLALLLGLGPLAAQIPLAVLAGILVKVGLDILDYRLLKRISGTPKPEVIIMLSVFALTVLVDLVIAVGVGVVLAMGLVTWRMAKTAHIHLEDDELLDVPDDPKHPGVRLVRLSGPLFFGSMAEMLDRMDKVDQVLDTHDIVLDCRGVDYMDLTAVFAIEDMLQKLQHKKLRPRLLLDDDALCQRLLALQSAVFTEQTLCMSVEQVLERCRTTGKRISKP
ncbi:SulP family inorganic anion transporter [Alkalimonas sp. NCh-2]|uniref:SulP family inorganic anion transporter n=1 Tax=Alkalimonas sp. NCh-2 TaxID=3144846 RepID=UPI0031F62035